MRTITTAEFLAIPSTDLPGVTDSEDQGAGVAWRLLRELHEEGHTWVSLYGTSTRWAGRRRIVASTAREGQR